MIFNISNSPNDWIELEKESLKETIVSAAKVARSIENLSKEIDVPSSRIRKFTCTKGRRTNISIDDFRKVISFLGKNSKVYYKSLKISSMGRNRLIEEPKFPIDFSSVEGVRLIADVLTDGALTMPRGTLEYMNTNEQEIINSIKSMNELFCNHKIEADNAKEAVVKSKIKCKVYKYDTSNYGGRSPYFILKYPQTVGKFFLAAGIPAGKKVYTNPKIPSFILNSNREIIIAFLERAIINEGHVKPTLISIGHSTATNNTPELIKGYMILFYRLGIKTSKPHIMKTYTTQNGSKRAYWRITITGRNLDAIRDTFDLHSKQKSIKSRTFQSRWKPHERIEQIINAINKADSISARKLANSLGISTSLISMYAKDLESTGRVKRRKDGVNVYYERV